MLFPNTLSIVPATSVLSESWDPVVWFGQDHGQLVTESGPYPRPCEFLGSFFYISF